MHDPEIIAEIRAALSDLKSGQRLAMEKLESLCTFINGPDDEAEKGLKVRFDRVEQAQKRQAKWAGTAITAAIGAAVTGLWALLTGK